MTLFSGPCAQKNYQFLIPFVISVTAVSWCSWDTTHRSGVLYRFPIRTSVTDLHQPAAKGVSEQLKEGITAGLYDENPQ